jgi:hypothetical protein
VIVPVVALHEPSRRRLRGLVPVVPLSVALLFAGTLALPKLASAVFAGELGDISTPVGLGLDEIRESVLELLLALTGFLAYSAARRRKYDPTHTESRAP